MIIKLESYRVIVTEPIHSDGIRVFEEKGIRVDQLPQGSDETSLLKEVSRADALITRGGIKVNREIMAASHRLKAVGIHGVGYDHVDLEAAKMLDIKVFNTPSALTESVAEMTLAMMLAITRRVAAADKAVRAGEWKRKFGDLIGSDLMGKTIGIVGLGRIGEAVARRLKPFGVLLIYSDVADRSKVEEELGLNRVQLETLLKESDIITLHTPLTPETCGLISRRELGLMKNGVYLVNTSRGKVIDQTALIDSLNNGKIAGAALDVFEEEPLEPDNPLTSMDNVVITPHISSSSKESLRRMAVQVAEGVIKVLRGGVPKNLLVV